MTSYHLRFIFLLVCSYNTFPNQLNCDYFAQTESLLVSSPPSILSSSCDAKALPSSSTASSPPIVSSTTFSAARRSRQEIRAAQRAARADRASPRAWAKCLLSHVISLWFVHAPAFVRNNDARATKNVRFVFEVMEVLLGSDYVQLEEVRPLALHVQKELKYKMRREKSLAAPLRAHIA